MREPTTRVECTSRSKPTTTRPPVRSAGVRRESCRHYDTSPAGSQTSLQRGGIADHDTADHTRLYQTPDEAADAVGAPVLVNHPRYGEWTMFGSIAEAQAAIRACGPEFSGVTLWIVGGQIFDERDEIVGQVED